MRFLLRVIVKALLLFALINVVVTAAPPRLDKISAYNSLFPGRPRFPFGEAPREAYNFSLSDVDAMFAAHVVSAPRMVDEYRVFLIGDSSVWGTLLRPEETLAGQLNAANLRATDNRPMRFYNLGYPTISVTKDLLLLDRALAYNPDMVIWLVTLEAFPREKQLAVALVEDNPLAGTALIERYGLNLEAASLNPPAWWQRTLIGQRKALADLARLQIYGLLWAATGIDQTYPADYPRAQVDLEADPTYNGQQALDTGTLAFDTVAAGQAALEGIPLLLVNEPILISSGENSDVRYNFYYPRGAYDRYRVWLAEEAGRAGILYVDLWNIVPAEEFTNSAIHYNRSGAGRVRDALIQLLTR